MAVTINWNTKVISVPKADLTLVQASPTEIYELNLNWFRMQLKDLEDSEEGIVFLDTHRHNTEVTLGGLTYARVVEIINGYTVTFEDGQYAVNLVGANSNVGDVINVNQVSVRSYNSAGLISNSAIEYASFNGGVTIDVVNGVAGTLYNVGTPENPVNNLDDALLIADYRGFTTLLVRGNLTIPNGINIENFELVGQSQVKTIINLEAGADTNGVEIQNATVSGILDGDTLLEECVVLSLVYFNGYIKDSGLVGEITLAGNQNAILPNCYTVDQDNPPIINMGNTGQSLSMPNYSGIINIKNLNDSDSEIGIGLNSGYIILEDTITAGTIIISGVGVLTDNTTGTAVVGTDGLMSRDTVSEATWDIAVSNHLTSGTTGEALDFASSGGDLSGLETTLSGIDINISRVLGLVQENQFIDQNVYSTYNGQKLLTSARLRTYTDKASVGTSSNLLATYQITATWSGDELQTYKVVKV